jgi:hypothetical protein
MWVKHIWLWLVALLLLIGVAGCGGDTSGVTEDDATEATEQVPATTTEADDTASEAYPAAGGMPTPIPAYPDPDQSSPAVGREPEPVPTPGDETGVVHGELYNLDTDEPIYEGITVYLSNVIPTDNPEMDAVSLDPASDPNVIPDREGGFAFADVPPGRYGIVVQGPLNKYVARYADDQQEDVIITVEAGQTVELGRVYSGYP